MKILFVSGDIGGARALLPVIAECETHSTPFAVVKHGYMADHFPAHWEAVSPRMMSNPLTLIRYFRENRVSALVFSSSVKDTIALSFARQAKAFGIPVIHVLDAWSGYARRMEMDGQTALLPDTYTVMDELAFQEAVKDGIDPSVLAISGQPALAALQDEYAGHREKTVSHGWGLEDTARSTIRILFVSEPVEQDQGNSRRFPQYRGYTEKEVFGQFLQGLQRFADQVFVGILPHPREDRDILRSLWQRGRGALKGGLIETPDGRESLFAADGVAGMASILLYEAWLIGKPVISLQPNLRLAPLRMFAKREAVTFVDALDHFHNALGGWADQLQRRKNTTAQPDLAFHRDAPGRVFELIVKSMPSGTEIPELAKTESIS